MILLVMGEFGVGKDLVADYLCELIGEKAQKIKSYCTREPRYENEDTHIFVVKDNNSEPDENTAAWTKIGQDYYWTEKDQFDLNLINIYVVDNVGALDIITANIDNVYVLEVIRPEWMRNIPSYRLGREAGRELKKPVPVDYRLLNTVTLSELKRQLADFVKNHIEDEI